MAYDHMKAVDALSEDEYWENMRWLMKSQRQALDGVLITCRGCEEDFKPIALYRCFFCGCYFCARCSVEHFGERSTI